MCWDGAGTKGSPAHKGNCHTDAPNIYIYNLYRDRTISISYVKGWLV